MGVTGNWIENGSQRVRFNEEQGHLVKETDQPDRGLILSSIADERKEPAKQSFLGGYKVGSIPFIDWERIVLPKYPELMDGDAEIAKKALIRFSNDPDMAIYLVKKA